MCTVVPPSCSCRRRSWSGALAGGSPPLVPVLVGPTGAGKTAIAAALGRLAAITVISADARQVYRHLDIGTAKPSADVLAEVRVAGREPLVVGGTGFYVRALADGLFREPPLDPARRERVRGWAARLAPASVAHWAARLDRGFAGGGRQRAARAIEVALLSGRPRSWCQREARETGAMRP